MPNRRVGRNKCAGGKILKKHHTKIRPCRGEFFLIINKRARQIPIYMQYAICNKRAGVFFSQNQ